MLLAPLVLLKLKRRTPIISGAASHILRGALAIGLVVMFLFASLGSTSSAEQLSNPEGSEFKYFILYQGPDGDLVCRGATLAEKGEFDRIDPSTQRLRPINHLEADRYAHRRARTSAAAVAAPNLTIILRATAQLDANPAAKAAFIKAAQNWETIIKSPITIYIDVDYGEKNFGQDWGASVLASTGSPEQTHPYQSVRFNLLAEATGEGNATKQAIFNALPTTAVPTDLGNSGSTSVSNSIARAIGLLPATAQSTDSAARIAFNSARAYDFDASDGVPAGQFDFESVATHEIGHALGFVSDAGTSATVPRVAIWDLYRFRTGTTSGTFTNAQRIVTIGGSPDPLQFYFAPGNSELGLSTGGPAASTNNGGDGRQSSHWKFVSSCGGAIGIMDPAIGSGCTRFIGLNDKLAISLFGYNLTNNNAPPPPPPPPQAPANDNFANAQALSGCTGSVTGTNVGATKETGEQSPESPQSNKTVWYQWQAPSTGSVTVNTVGSDFDTVLAVYTGTAVNGLTLLGSNDDNEDPNTPEHETSSQVIFSATQGTVYRIQVNGFNNGGSLGDVGSIQLNWTESPCSQQAPPTILTEDGAPTKAAALNSVTFVRGPFKVIDTNNFSSDQHTRVILFTSNLGSSPNVTVTAGGTSLTVENVGSLSGVAGLDASYIIVRLPTGLATGELPLVVTLNGVASSNSPTLGISP